MDSDLTSGDFLRLSDFSQARVLGLLETAADQREVSRNRSSSGWCEGRRVAFIWDGDGFRNRAAFEIAVAEGGGVGVQIPGALGEREAIPDLAAYLDNWFDALVVRTPSFARLQELADQAATPVINARTFHNHPCEILGDLAFIRHLRGSVNGLTVMFVGEASNLLHSWCEAAAVLDLNVIQVCPPGYEVDLEWLSSLSPDALARVTVMNEPGEAIGSAEIIYTDCWPAGTADRDCRFVQEAFAPLRVTASLLSQADPDALFLPCPPVTRGEEVSADAMTDPRCRVIEAKEWLLPAQAALLADVLAPDSAATTRYD